jgi:hypothetical protein
MDDQERHLAVMRTVIAALRLAAAGRGNRDIASELSISPKTASVHVSNILAKLGVSTRTEAAAIVHRMAGDLSGPKSSLSSPPAARTALEYGFRPMRRRAP